MVDEITIEIPRARIDPVKLIALVSAFAQLHDWRLELPDLTGRVFYFRSGNHKTVRVEFNAILLELAALGADLVTGQL